MKKIILQEQENIKKLPSNINIVISSVYINKPFEKEYIKSLQTCFYPSQAVKGNYTNCLKCFTVYNDENKQKSASGFLCKNSCATCLKCYKKSKDIIYINEKIH